MSTHANAKPFYQSTNSSTSTLRPRNTRLISYEDGGSNGMEVATPPSASSTPSHSHSRSRSPLARSGQTRSKGNIHTTNLCDSNVHKRTISENVDRRASNGLWDSWSSIQGIASTFLSSDGSNDAPLRRASSTNVKKHSIGRMQPEKNYGLKQAHPEWGPKSQAETKPASIEEHKALLQAKKREALLLQGVEANRGKDAFGRYKRKDSNASMRSPVDTNNMEDDILVYRHKVKVEDTMPGIVIKYSCQPEAFRKVNRFWPNDNVQRRDYVILPVDACSVKGRKTDAPYVADLIGSDDPSASLQKPPKNSTTQHEDEPSTAHRPSIEPFPEANTNNDSPNYRHDTWVHLPSFQEPVEILRVSKRTLGYFPPSRRKSPSVAPTPFTDSATSTPKTSFDMLRHPPTHAAQQAQLNHQLNHSLSLNSSPVRQSSVPRYLRSPSQTRSSSTVSVSNGTTQNAFMTALSGPGGVGTLRGLRTERARPGPAEDSLNKKFAHYFPDQLPLDHPDGQAQNSLQPPHSRAASNSLRATPRASIDSIRSTRSNSSSVPAAIAGWVGKVASSPMRKKGDANRMERNELGTLGELAVDDMSMGDLIELADTPDEVSKQLHDEVTPSAMPVFEDGRVARNEDELLNERFPIRGRVRRAYEAD